MENIEIEVNVTDVTGINESEIQSMNESAVMSGLEVHSTPIVVQDRELNESAVIDDSGIQLTPTSTNKNKQSDNYEIYEMLQAMLDVKFKEQNNELRGVCLLYTSFDNGGATKYLVKYESISSSEITYDKIRILVLEVLYYIQVLLKGCWEIKKLVITTYTTDS